MKKIEDTNKKLFGEYAIAASGFDKNEQQRLIEVSEKIFSSLKVVFVDLNLEQKTLSEVFSMKHRYGFLQSLSQKKAVIMSGFLEKDIVSFMKTMREYGISPQLWAVLTPTSVNWKFKDLVKELEEEAKQISEMQKKHKK